LRETRKRRAAEQALAYQANHDPATGLANRTLFNDRLRQAMVAAERAGRKVAVLALTMDRYRGVKASLGHDACNALLMHAASALESSLREGDTVARLLGNEFAVIVGDLANDEDVLPVAAKLLAAVKHPMRWQDNIVTSTASIGIALMKEDGSDASGLLRSANAAMAQALGLGGNRFRFHAPEMNDRTSRRFALEAELRRALVHNELILHYQPRAVTGDGSLAGAEALVRWQHPTRGLVMPGDFIPLAESSGLIVPLGAWVIREACRQLRAWREAGLPMVPIAVNLSPRQFREEGLVEHIEVALAENEVPPALLGFEITESMVMDNIDDAVAKLNELKATGIKLSLDDFGTGHSSLARLRELPVDYLKIGQSFVRQLGSEQADEAICRSIIDLGHNLDMQIVAEGVETLLQREWLRAHHCDEIQGYFYARPMPADAFARLLAADLPRSHTMLPLWNAFNYKG
jgi:diguanylate cyclase (GGDEF)-like protein